MLTFAQYEPRKPLPEHNLLKYYESPQEEDGEDFYFIKQENYLLVYSERLHVYPPTSPRYGTQKLLADQFEMPLEAVRWLINVIEQKFFKSPEEGGLPANKISYEEIVAGEDLHVMRSTNAGCPHPGYDITNGSRRSHLSPRNLQTLSLSDPWLFKNGLMDYLKSLADDYEQGRQ